MYLKEIKISGFKSFADKTNITLDDNITCIVGPNGSGKSTTINSILALLKYQSGTIKIFGQEMKPDSYAKKITNPIPIL